MSTPDPSSLPAAPPAAAPRKRGRWFWLFQIVPPLLLIYLMLTDNGPGAYFGLMPMMIFAFGSVVSLLIRVVARLFGRGDWRRFLRPLLTLGVFAASMAYVQWSLREVRVVAAAEAERIQAECVRAGRCPDALTIGREDGLRRWIGTPSTHLTWPILYRLTDDGFELYLDETLDASRHWTGGPHAELRGESLIEGNSELFDD